MKATEAKLLSFLQKSPQFVIPIYQRTYSWTDKQCRQLWDDILRAGSSDTIAVHFIGSIVYVEQGRAVQFSSCEGCAIAMRVEGAVFGLKTSLPVIGKA